MTSETPAPSASGVATNSNVTVTFNESVQSGTISFTLTSSAGSAVTATVSYNSSTDTVTLTPSAALAYSMTYTATVSGAENSSGVAMTAPFTWSFTTAAAPTLPNGLVAEWQFNQGSGTTTADNTGDGHTGTLYE